MVPLPSADLTRTRGAPTLGEEWRGFMAALRFEARADGGPTVHRLGHRDLESNLHTWETEVRTYLFRNGSGYVVVLRKGRAVHRYDFPAEDVEIPPMAPIGG